MNGKRKVVVAALWPANKSRTAQASKPPAAAAVALAIAAS